MSKRDSNWYIPADWLIFLTIPCIAVLTSMLLPVVARLKTTDLGTLYALGVVAGVVGIILPFIARLPLYRAHRFWTLGPGQLDRKHRRFYWLAYASVALSLLLLWVVWLRTR